MGLFEVLGMGAAKGADVDAPAPELAPADRFFEPDAVALLAAARGGNEAEMRRLIAAGVSPNSQGPKSPSKATPQITLLNHATAEHDERAIALLIAHGADPLFKPREDDGDAFLFAIVRHDAAMLDVLYRHWPFSKIPLAIQSKDAFSALRFDCRPCLDAMFRNGLTPGIADARGYNLFMAALDREDLDTAEWLLVTIHVPITMESSGGVTPANSVQAGLARYRPGTPTFAQLTRLKAFMETKGVVFPVETPTEIRVRKGIK